MDEKKLCKIGQAAQASGVSIDTIRYYEKEGLIQTAPRSEGGFRLYGHDAIDRLSFIKKAQRFGLTLAEIRQIMRESDKGLQSCCAYVGRLLKDKLAELEGEITELQRTRKSLEELMKSWIPPEEVKKRTFTVCPQIERANTTRGGKKNGKKKR